MMDVLCFGEPLVGFYPSKIGPIADSTTIVKTWGGDTSNVAIGVARLGKQSSYLTRVGMDPFGKGFLNLWKENNVDTSLVVVDEKRNTGLYFVSFEDKQHHHLTYYRKESAASALSEKDIFNDIVDKYKAIHLSGISIGMSTSALKASRKLVEVAKKLNKIISFDVNYRAAQWSSAVAAAKNISRIINLGVDILEITNDEMKSLGWGDSPEVLYSKFPNCKVIILKQGKEGATIITSKSSFHIDAMTVEIKDTVGAGDSFDSGFLVSYLDGKTLEECARIGTASAALTCTGTGPFEKMPSIGEVIKFLKSSDDINGFENS